MLYSATASCPHQLSRASSFYADLCRANVALSRAHQKLIIVVASTLLDITPHDTAQYQQLRLWKCIKKMCEECSMEGGSSSSSSVACPVANGRNTSRMGSSSSSGLQAGVVGHDRGCGAGKLFAAPVVQATEVAAGRLRSGLKQGGREGVEQAHMIRIHRFK